MKQSPSVPIPAGEYLSPAQAGAILGVSAERVRQLVREGVLPAVVSPLGRLLRREAVEAELARRLAEVSAA